MAYAYLNPEQPEQRKVLEGRVPEEKDPSLKNVLRLRLGYDGASVVKTTPVPTLPVVEGKRQ